MPTLRNVMQKSAEGRILLDPRWDSPGTPAPRWLTKGNVTAATCVRKFGVTMLGRLDYSDDPASKVNGVRVRTTGVRVLLSFAEALAASDDASGPRHLLLGNGFSIAYDYDSFAYGKLVEEADFSNLSIDARELFRLLGTADFEKIIEALRLAALLIDLYAPSDPALATSLAADANALKNALAEVLARKHPDNVGSISPDEYTRARKFLEHFERIFTVNYDLLLYWATMQDGPEQVARNDGFAESEEDPGADYVAWQPLATWSSQRLYYLHGALHLFDAGA